jgi:transcriptional regulator with XRE-family HTH domain
MLVPVPQVADLEPNGEEAEPRLTARQLAQVAERLRELRGSAISQRELARRTGLSAGTIGQIEQGRHEPRLGTLLALRGALGVGSIEELLGPMPSTALESVREDR